MTPYSVTRLLKYIARSRGRIPVPLLLYRYGNPDYVNKIGRPKLLVYRVQTEIFNNRFHHGHAITFSLSGDTARIGGSNDLRGMFYPRLRGRKPLDWRSVLKPWANHNGV